MSYYPTPTPEDVAFFAEHGYLVLADVIPPADLDELEARCAPLVDHRDKLAFDWAWDAAEERDQRSFRIVQSSPAIVWPEIVDAPHHIWVLDYASALMGMQLEILLDMFLAKPPGASTPTEWHQDEGYWGRNLDDRGITCWIPLQDVDEASGCMQFIDGGHRTGVLQHRLVDGVQSDLLCCEPDTSRAVVCPIRRGSVTFHHSKTPHMTAANSGTGWRRVVTQHMQAAGAGGEGGHYPWKVYVNQRTGERTIPPRS